MRNNDDDGDNNNGVCVMCGTSNKRQDEQKQTNTIIPFSPSLDKYNLLTNNSRKQAEEKSTEKRMKTYISEAASDQREKNSTSISNSCAFSCLSSTWFFYPEASYVQSTLCCMYLIISTIFSMLWIFQREEQKNKQVFFVHTVHIYKNIVQYFSLEVETAVFIWKRMNEQQTQTILFL